MKKTSNTITLVILLSMLCLVAAGGYGFLFSRLSQTNDRSAAILGEIRAEEKRAEEERLLGDLVADTEEERAAVSGRFVGKEDIVSFIERIEETAVVAGVKAEVASVDLKPVKDLVSKEAIALRLSSTGSWRNTLHFAALLESLPYVLEVRSVSAVTSGLPPAEAKSATPGVRQWVSQFDITALKHK